MPQQSARERILAEIADGLPKVRLARRIGIRRSTIYLITEPDKYRNKFRASSDEIQSIARHYGVSEDSVAADVVEAPDQDAAPGQLQHQDGAA